MQRQPQCNGVEPHKESSGTDFHANSYKWHYELRPIFQTPCTSKKYIWVKWIYSQDNWEGKKKSAFTERYSTNLRHNLSELIPECPKTVNINPLRILYSENYNYWLVI